MNTKQTIIILPILAIFGLWVWFYIYKPCSDRGGVIVKTAFSYECVELKTI